MCRLTAYKGVNFFVKCKFTVNNNNELILYVLGTPILIGDVLTKPNNSLVCQSRDATYHPGVEDKTNERNIVGKNTVLMYLFIFRGAYSYYLQIK